MLYIHNSFLSLKPSSAKKVKATEYQLGRPVSIFGISDLLGACSMLGKAAF